ncbi:HAD-like domain-containing protein [Lentinula raphanica]|uniref:HAD-like domain-containing protein n=1 Tax=Lentinula raphanica TaxID=153919 RepID=A0AA38UI48_9AGAR|nr:HAD-like domain-containing protein [Lentinula raphanica]
MSASELLQASEGNNSGTGILNGVEVLVFDVFGTVVDWRTSVTKELERLGKRYGLSDSPQDWLEFTNEWRKAYMENTFRISQGGEGSLSVDIIHRESLDKMLSSSRWSHVGEVLDEPARADLNYIWHRLDGWPDTVPALHAFKANPEAKPIILAALSNGNLRLLVDMAKHVGLPWDVVLSTALFGTYKPNPNVYLSALSHLSLSSTPHKAVMVAAHLFDLRGAKGVGMKTVYVRRPGEDVFRSTHGIEAKELEQTDYVDAVIDDFTELVKLF